LWASGRPTSPFSPCGRRGLLTGVDFLASPCVPSPVSAIRTPNLPLLPVWEKGVRGMRGQTRAGMQQTAYRTQERSPWAGTPAYPGGGACVPSPILGFRTPNLPLLPVWEKGVAHRGRFFGKPLRAISRFSHQDDRTPPSPRVEEGGWWERGPKAYGNAEHRSSLPKTLPLRGQVHRRCARPMRAVPAVNCSVLRC